MKEAGHESFLRFVVWKSDLWKEGGHEKEGDVLLRGRITYLSGARIWHDMVVLWRCVGEEDSCTEIVTSDGSRHTIYVLCRCFGEEDSCIEVVVRCYVAREVWQQVNLG